MSDFRIEFYNKSRARLVSDDEKQLNEAVVLFSYQKRVFGNYSIDSGIGGTGVYSCISPNFTFKIGLVFDIAKKLKDFGYSIKIDKKLKDYIRPTTTINETLIQPNASFTYRDYQENAIKSVGKKGRGIIEIPTSGGKSLILFGICSNIKEFSEKTLIIVPRIQLVEQFYKEWIKEYGFKGISMFSKKHPEINKDAKVIVTNYQWLVSKDKKISVGKKERLIRDQNIKAIIIDEAHSIGDSGSWLSRFVSKFDTPYKIGCTGTVPESEDLSKRWNCIGVLGSVIYKKEIIELQETNQIAKIKIIPICLEHNRRAKSEQCWVERDNVCFSIEDNKVLSGTEMYTTEYKYLESHNGANNIILDIVENLKGNTIVLIDHTEHAQYLYDNCKCKKFLITGKVKLERRKEAAELLDMKNDEKYIIFANSNAAGTGLSIKNLQNVVIASHGKALTKVIQGIGRVLRKLKKDGEEEIYNLIDIHHNFLFSKKHFDSRCRLYRKKYHKACKNFKHILVPIKTQNETRNNELDSL